MRPQHRHNTATIFPTIDQNRWHTDECCVIPNEGPPEGHALCLVVGRTSRITKPPKKPPQKKRKRKQKQEKTRGAHAPNTVQMAHAPVHGNTATALLLHQSWRTLQMVQAAAWVQHGLSAGARAAAACAFSVA